MMTVKADVGSLLTSCSGLRAAAAVKQHGVGGAAAAAMVFSSAYRLYCYRSSYHRDTDFTLAPSGAGKIKNSNKK